MQYPAPYRNLDFNRDAYRNAMIRNAYIRLQWARIAKADGNAERTRENVTKARAYMHHALTVTPHASA